MKKEKSNQSKIIHVYIIILVIFIVCAVAAIIMLKYQVEGEKNPPFIMTDFMLISTAEGNSTEAKEGEKWNFSLNQNNDFYLVIKKNDNYKKNETIKKVSIENIEIVERPSIGTIKIYRPAEEGLYKTEDTYLIENRIEYKGTKQSSIKDLQIANQGGVILFRIANQQIGEYASNEEEIIHDGTILAKANIEKEQIAAKVSFDIVIETGNGVSYKANMIQEIPTGNLLEEGKGTLDKKDLSDIVFKRI